MTLRARGPIFCAQSYHPHFLCVNVCQSQLLVTLFFLLLYPLSHISRRKVGWSFGIFTFSVTIYPVIFGYGVTSSIFTLPRIVMIGSLFEASLSIEQSIGIKTCLQMHHCFLLSVIKTESFDSIFVTRLKQTHTNDFFKC